MQAVVRYRGPEPCTELAALMQQWREATEHLSNSVARLSNVAETASAVEFAELLGQSEIARKGAEAARMRVELHKAEHGC
jgi:hypothetical protein